MSCIKLNVMCMIPMHFTTPIPLHILANDLISKKENCETFQLIFNHREWGQCRAWIIVVKMVLLKLRHLTNWQECNNSECRALLDVSFWRSFELRGTIHEAVEGSFPSAQKCSRWRYRGLELRSKCLVQQSLRQFTALRSHACHELLMMAPALKNLLLLARALKPPLVSSETWSSNSHLWRPYLGLYLFDIWSLAQRNADSTHFLLT